MQFFYHKDSGLESIALDSKDSHYLFHVRRFKQGETLLTTNLNDMQLYSYKHEKKNIFKLIGLHSKAAQPKAYTHILLAMIDLKDIYDILPTLNALNVASLRLFYADFSQKNRKIDIQKAQRILQYSCMQCGRMKPLEIAIHNNLESVCKAFPNAIAIDFLDSSVEVQDRENLDSNNYRFEQNKASQNLDSNKNTPLFLDTQNNKNLSQTPSKQAQQTFENLTQQERQNTAKNGIIIGCEGGFSHNERKFLHTTHKVYALQTPFILTAHLVSTHIASLCV